MSGSGNFINLKVHDVVHTKIYFWHVSISDIYLKISSPILRRADFCTRYCVQHAALSLVGYIFVCPLDGCKGGFFLAEVELEKGVEEQTLFMYCGTATEQDVDVAEEEDEWTRAVETISEQYL